MRLLRIVAGIFAVLLVLLGLVAPSFAAPPRPAIIEEGRLTGNGTHKLPSVATGSGRLYAAWSNTNEANFAERPEELSGFESTRLGSNGGSSTYFNAAVAVGSDGTLHYAWIEGGHTIRHRSRAPGQGWSGDYVAASGQNFANALALTVEGSGKVFAAWRDAEGQLSFAYSDSAGANWPVVGRVPMSELSYAGTPRLAAGAGAVYMTWTGRDNGNIFVGQWNGNNFAASAITSGRNANFNPTVAVGPDGRAVVAFRHVNNGVFYAERQPGGGWQLSQLVSSSTVAGPVAVVVDSQNNIHLAWSNEIGGQRNVWYALKTPTEAFSEPVVVSRDGNGFKTNVDLAVSVQSGYVLAHVVWESFVGGQFIRYARVRTDVGTAPAPPVPTPTPRPNAPVTGSFDFADTAFRDLWTRTDSLVKSNAVNYSWIWGPSAFTQAVQEYYVQSPQQTRLVQYFDKSRMEIIQPGAARGPYYVTNGRLTDELITGLLQTGDAQYEQKAAAALPVAGDPDNTFPLYRDLQSVYRKPRADNQANQELFRAPDGSVQTQPVPNANNDPSMAIAQRVGGLGIPKIFWDFMNRPGQVLENGSIVTATPFFDWRYVAGDPLTEAYWVFIKVNGVDRGVLVQAFERRLLTYTPTNAPEFQVEMGNIGRHYFEWRYGVRP